MSTRCPKILRKSQMVMHLKALQNKNLAHERIILTEWNVLFFLFPIGPFQNFMICILALIPFFLHWFIRLLFLEFPTFQKQLSDV